LTQRNIEVRNMINHSKPITMNDAIMDYAIKYASNEKKKCKKLQKINRVRLFEKMLLPFELVNVDGRQPTNAYYN